MPLILSGRRIQILMEKPGDLPTKHSHPHVIGIIIWAQFVCGDFILEAKHD